MRVERSLRERPSVLHELIVRSERTSLTARSERFWCSLCLCGRKCQQHHGIQTAPGARRKCFLRVERSLRERPSVLHELIVRSGLTSLTARSECFWFKLCGRTCEQNHPGTTTTQIRHLEHAASVLARVERRFCERRRKYFACVERRFRERPGKRPLHPVGVQNCSSFCVLCGDCMSSNGVRVRSTCPCVVESTSTSFGRACRLLDTRWPFSIKVQKSSCPLLSIWLIFSDLPARAFISFPFFRL